MKRDQAPLRDGCDAGADTVAALPAGTPVSILYQLSGESTACFKIEVQVSGQTERGFLTAADLDGLETFEEGTKQAAWLDLNQVMTAVRSTPVKLPPAASALAAVKHAEDLIQTGQPEQALETLEPQLGSHRDPGLLALAGAAAWRADDPAKALEYWRASLALQPNPEIESLYHRVERETQGDQSTARLFGTHVALRYEPGAIPVETARQIVSALDEEFARISSGLGCTAEERIIAIAQSPEAYRKTTAAAEWSGGQFDGRIRVPVFPGATLDSGLRHTLAHEITHACLSLLGQWPAWLQEGMAQKLSGDTVTPELQQRLAEWKKDGKLPDLNRLGQDWSRLDSEHAVAAYALSLAAVELLYQQRGSDGVRQLLHNPDRLPAITAGLDADLGRQLGL